MFFYDSHKQRLKEVFANGHFLQSITQIKFTRWINDTGVHTDKIKAHEQERAQ